MPWKIVERRIGRAGGIKQREARQREWDRIYGEDSWMVGYVLDDEFVSQETAFEKIYCKSYEEHFRDHPEDLQELLRTASVLNNPHALATTGVDLQVPAIMAYLHKHGLSLRGNEPVDIGTYGKRSHPLSVRLSPLQVKAAGLEGRTLEAFWQKNKCLAVWEPEPRARRSPSDTRPSSGRPSST